MKKLRNAAEFACILYVLFLTITAGVFAGLQLHEFSQNHILVNFQRIHYQDGLPSEHVQIDVSRVSPFHQADQYYLYMIAEAYSADENGNWGSTEWSDQVREGKHFVAHDIPEDAKIDWRIVCSKTPLSTYEEVAKRNPYGMNYILFGNDVPDGLQKLRCR